jgi:hypothetical protein
MCLVAICAICCPCLCRKRKQQITIAGKMDDIDMKDNKDKKKGGSKTTGNS